MADQLVRNKTDADSHRNGQDAEDNGIAPLSGVQFSDGEGWTTNVDYQDLAAHDDELDANEPIVSQNSLKDIDSIIEPAGAARHLAQSFPLISEDPSIELTCTD